MAFDPTSSGVVVVIGVGGMGLACARHLANGRRLLCADYSDQNLATAKSKLFDDGHLIQSYNLDITDYDSVLKFAKNCSEVGKIDVIVHTAGASGVSVGLKALYDIDLIGTANVIDAFFTVVTPGTNLICISSMAGHAVSSHISAELERHLALASRDNLLEHKEIAFDIPKGLAYSIAKRGNQVRVQAAARAWGAKGARINSISPGVINTPMGRAELERGESAAMIREYLDLSACQRMGTPEDIAHAVAFLASPQAAFITGADILVDGGQVWSRKWHSADSVN